ncbi:Glycosyl hydrolases family 28 [Musa troglodytarum]|uniref:Glycosyl hydrolases family 28 n=1 Tax=Musa troglodytarum TaxID=320322 RepID=A0A9E7FTS3_9LILI|nr:Glycosyl hydrolases family 28 [Musa troglodytarum]
MKIRWQCKCVCQGFFVRAKHAKLVLKPVAGGGKCLYPPVDVLDLFRSITLCLAWGWFPSFLVFFLIFFCFIKTIKNTPFLFFSLPLNRPSIQGRKEGRLGMQYKASGPRSYLPFFIGHPPPTTSPALRGNAFLGVAVLLLLAVAGAVDGDERSDGYCKHTSGSTPRPHSVTITEFGAVGDGVTLNTVAFQNAVFYVRSFADKGGAQLYVPKGRWLTGSFDLTSHLTLFLDKDAVIIGSQGSVWWEWFHSHTLNYSRPHLLELVSSSDIVVSNLTFLNPPAWSIHPVYSSNVTIQNIIIHASSDSPYTDGIVPDSCSNFHIEDCSISVGHDAIVLKSGWDNYGIAFGKPSSNIQINNVHLQSSLGSALAFGSEMSGGISDVSVEHLYVRNSHTGINFKTTRGRGGYIEDIVISDVKMENVHEAIRFTGYCGAHPDDQYDPDVVPVVKRVTIKDVIGSNISIAGVFSGIDHDPFTAICLANISLPITSDLSDPWTCSNVAGFSDSVFPQPCLDLSLNSSLFCFSLETFRAIAEI